MSTGNWIKDARKTKGWTQIQLAKKIGTSSSLISQWETGKFNPGAKYNSRLEEVLLESEKGASTKPSK